MKKAADFRRIARDALRGKWSMAVIVGVVAAMLGGAGSGGMEIELEANDFGVYANLELAGQTIYSTGGEVPQGVLTFLAGGAIYITLLLLVMAALYFVLSSVVAVGYARSNLDLVDGGEASFGALFGYFPHWKIAAWARLRRGLVVFLWSLLLVIPGILAGFSYAMMEDEE